MSKSRKIILALAVIGFLACVLSLVFYFWNTGRAQRAFDLLDSKRPVLNSAGFTAPERLEEIAEEEERPFNPDCIAWVTIPDTAVNYPVMQREGSNQYYLRRDFYGEYSQSGTPFLDAASDLADPDSPLYIFGHNMKSGTMFADLLQRASRHRAGNGRGAAPIRDLRCHRNRNRHGRAGDLRFRRGSRAGSGRLLRLTAGKGALRHRHPAGGTAAPAHHLHQFLR